MKRTILCSLVVAACATSIYAQKNTVYAITGAQKGQSGWAQVKLIDITTGQEVKTIYKADDPVDILNARTGKPVVKKDLAPVANTDAALAERADIIIKKYEKGADGKMILQPDENNNTVVRKRYAVYRQNVQTDKPFATTSAACAYDKKHDRLYYTPMGINQLRYIDLKDENTKVYYFEDETFGVLNGRHDVPNQITRMVIGADGNGYALTNNGEHLMRFTTKKKPEITDLGTLTDDAANGRFSIHAGNVYGGDMIADDKGNFYLISAARTVFKIDLESKVATYKGTISGLPAYYSTNGAVVAEGTTVIVSSANSTEGYFKFDINTLAAEKMSNGGSVFNASDLASSTLLVAKKINDNKEPVLEKEAIVFADMNKIESIGGENKVAVYPNPAIAGSSLKLSFSNLSSGKYNIQLLDVSGKVIGTKAVNLNGKTQMETYKLPELIGKGNYIIKITGADKKAVSLNKIVIQ